MFPSSLQSNDRLHKIQKPERSIVKRYRALCDSLVDLAQTSENESTRVAAHRVIQEYIVKPLKQQYLEERKARAESKESTPKAISFAVSNLPVGQQAIVGIKIEPESKHNSRSRNLDVVDYTTPTITKIEDDLSQATPRGAGEAADKAVPDEITVYDPTHFLDNPKEPSYATPQTRLQCSQSSNPETTRFRSPSGYRSESETFWWDSPISETRSLASSVQRSEPSCERTVKIFETAKDDRSPTVRRCPDCHAEWKRVQAKKVEVGKICLDCKGDIGYRKGPAVRCFRCAKKKRDLEAVRRKNELRQKELARRDANL
jgi:hypothetical protein